MKYPNFSLERRLLKQGYQNIAGIDEVGRGALAGPIIAVAAMVRYFAKGGSASGGKVQSTRNKPWPVPAQRDKQGRQIPINKFQISKKLKIRDSKLLSENIREAMFEKLSKKVIWSVGIVTHQEIDKIGITRANILVFKRALRKLEIQPDYLLLDKISGFKHRLPFLSIIDGDAKVMSITIASILAKVFRDRMMRGYHRKYPQYHFHQHKGYGTALHLKSLEECGICRIHRLSYAPVRRIYNNDK